MENIKLTDNQRAMLCWLDETDGKAPVNVGLKKGNPALASELILSLNNMGLVTKGTYSHVYGHQYTLTPQGIETASKTRYAKNGCLSCVKVFCVCSVSLLCHKGEGHSGCTGSHD